MSYGNANRYRKQLPCIDCGQFVDRQAYRCRSCARAELRTFKASLRTVPPTRPRREASTALHDESAAVLTGGRWIKNRRGVHVWVEGTAA